MPIRQVIRKFTGNFLPIGLEKILVSQKAIMLLFDVYTTAFLFNNQSKRKCIELAA